MRDTGSPLATVEDLAGASATSGKFVPVRTWEVTTLVGTYGESENLRLGLQESGLARVLRRVFRCIRLASTYRLFSLFSFRRGGEFA